MLAAFPSPSIYIFNPLALVPRNDGGGLGALEATEGGA